MLRRGSGGRGRAAGDAGGGRGGWAPPSSGAAAGLTGMLGAPAGSFSGNEAPDSSPAAASLLQQPRDGFGAASLPHPGRFIEAVLIMLSLTPCPYPGSWCCWRDGASLARRTTRERSTHLQVSESLPSTPSILWPFTALWCAAPLPCPGSILQHLAFYVFLVTLSEGTVLSSRTFPVGFGQPAVSPLKNTVRQGTCGAAGACVVTAAQSSHCFST